MELRQIFSMNTFDLITWLDETFILPQPSAIITMQDMEEASKALLKLSADYSYISELSSWAKELTREAKRSLSKTDYEDMVDKKDAVENKLNAIKQTYAGISRAVTIRLESNQELRMTGSRYAA